jgi:hypothetical protein
MFSVLNLPPQAANQTAYSLKIGGMRYFRLDVERSRVEGVPDAVRGIVEASPEK